MISEILRPSNMADFNLEKFQTLSKELSNIDLDSIDTELMHQTSIYSYYHGILQSAKRAYEQAVANIETYEAIRKTKLREDRRESGGSKCSVEELNNAVMATPEYASKREKCIATQEVYGLVKSICNTLEHKKDMLVQLSANKRMEAKIYS